MIEYKKIIQREPLTEAELNELGKQNWDNYHVEGNMFLFKRPLMVEAKKDIPAMVTPKIEQKKGGKK